MEPVCLVTESDFQQHWQGRVECPGWYAGAHTEPVVMKNGGTPTSHGICADCQSELSRQLDVMEAAKQLVPETAVRR